MISNNKFELLNSKLYDLSNLTLGASLKKLVIVNCELEFLSGIESARSLEEVDIPKVPFAFHTKIFLLKLL